MPSRLNGVGELKYSGTALVWKNARMSESPFNTRRGSGSGPPACTITPAAGTSTRELEATTATRAGGLRPYLDTPLRKCAPRSAPCRSTFTDSSGYFVHAHRRCAAQHLAHRSGAFDPASPPAANAAGKKPIGLGDL